MRKPHYWKRAKKTESPSEIIVVDTETYFGEQTLTPMGEWQTLRLGCALAYRLENGKRTRVKKLSFTKSIEFWAFVRSRLSKSRPVWIIGHNLPFDLGVLGGWKVICGDEYVVKKPCISGQMFYVKGYLNGCGLNFLDTINYYHCSLEKIGKSVGAEKMQMPLPTDSNESWDRYCSNDVEVTARGIEALIAFSKKHELGPWQPSIASNAFAAFRCRFMASNVFVHCHKKSLQLERRAYFGGIVETAYVGTIPSEYIYELDVCSMYPSVCREELPIRWLGYSERMGLKHIQELATRHMVFADVQIDSPDVQYPVKGKKGSYYPIGKFRTVLAHPELVDAIERGVVRHVHACSWYASGPIFNNYMQYFVKQKIAYGTEGNEAFENVCKLYATNLYGKTGQVTPCWLEWGKEALQIIEQRYGLEEGTLRHWYRKPPDMYDWTAGYKFEEIPIAMDIRNQYGYVEIKVGENESRDSCPAIAATVTSYARLLLRRFQRIAGPYNWYYCDTDSLWVNAQGLRHLEEHKCIRTQAIGYLDFKALHFYMDIHGPKDYQTDLVCKIKGIRANHEVTTDGGYCQLQFPGALAQVKSGMEDGVLVKHITKHLNRTITRCKVLDNGYTRPLVFPLENPEREIVEGKNVHKRRNEVNRDIHTGSSRPDQIV